MQSIFYSAESRGSAHHGWLQSFYTFSFAGYFNPNRMGFGTLRVLNDDVIAPSSGFGTHGHQDMEIISVPISGELRHKDNMNNSYVVKGSEIQVMSAGTGVLHSEFNNSDSENAHFLQIWILPKVKGISPKYDQKNFSLKDNRNHWVTMISPDGSHGSLTINQDAFLKRGLFDKNSTVEYEISRKNHGLFLMNLSGQFFLKNHSGEESELLQSKDALGVWDTSKIELVFEEDSEVLAIEVPMY